MKKHKYLVKQRNYYQLWTDEYVIVESENDDLEEDEFHEGLIGDSFYEKEVEREFMDVQETEIFKLEDLSEKEKSEFETMFKVKLDDESLLAEFCDDIQ